MSNPRVLAVLPGIIPSTLIGVVKPLIGLHRAGRIRARVVLESSASPRDVGETDLVVFCRNVEPRHVWLREMAQARGIPYVYVLDDDLFEVPEESEVGRYHHDPGRLQELERYVSGANLVSVFSPHLARRLRKINTRISLLTGWVDFGLLSPGRPQTQDEVIRIVYATSRADDRLADLFLDDLARALDDPGLQTEAHFWGYQPEKLARHPRVHFVGFTPDYDVFLRRFSRAGFDIGLAPLLDDEFHRSKSNNKFREYAACRVAGVYSNVEVYTGSVVDEETGLVVSTRPGAWYEAIARLTRDRSLREGIQDRAHRYALDHYSMEAAQDLWWSQIEGVLAEHRSRPPSEAIAGKAAPPGRQQATAGEQGATGSWSRRLRARTPRQILGTLKRRGFERWVLLKLQLATSAISSLLDSPLKGKPPSRGAAQVRSPSGKRDDVPSGANLGALLDHRTNSHPKRARIREGEVCAVVVTFNPDPAIAAHLSKVSATVSHLIVVDNSEDEERCAVKASSIGGHPDVIHNGANLGSATALNIGMRLAVEKGYPYVLILDQDSVPQQGMVQALVETHRRHPERHRVAIVAPQAIDPGIRSRPRYIRKWKGPLFELVRTGALPLENVTLVIASGALLPSEAILALGPFREDYFIDYVDTEYCLRALAHGYRIVVAGNACLHHHLGQQKAAKLGPLVVYPTRHTASRWYYMGRNRIPTLATYGARFPHWVAFDLAHGAYGLLRMLLTEDERGPKLAAYVRGTWDGFRGRMGPMPAQSEGPPTEGDRERQANR